MFAGDASVAIVCGRALVAGLARPCARCNGALSAARAGPMGTRERSAADPALFGCADQTMPGSQTRVRIGHPGDGRR